MSLAAKGLDLILIARHPEGLLAAQASIHQAYPACAIHLAPIDMENVEDVERHIQAILERFPAVAILVNAAGVLTLGASEMPTAQLLQLLTVNLTSTLIISNTVAKTMKAARNGHIFTIASLAGIENKAKLAIYASSKAGLISYSQALYSEMLQHNVNVTCLCPSLVNTDMTNDGRIHNDAKIQVADVVASLDFVLSLGEQASIARLELRCKILDAETFGYSGLPTSPLDA